MGECLERSFACAVANRSSRAYNAPVSSILRVEKLCKDYRMGDEVIGALIDATFTVEQGDFLAVMGASGSGKSTLLHLIGGLDIPSSGSVVIEGRDLACMSDHARTLFRRRRLGIVFQAFNLLPTLTASENVALPLLVAGADSRHTSARTRELLEIVDLTHRADHRPGALSGGEQQRVAIARALVKDPPILLCDEPTGELDFETAKHILGAMRMINELNRKTILLVTHNTAIGDMAHRVIRLRSGEIIEDKRNESPIDPQELRW